MSHDSSHQNHRFTILLIRRHLQVSLGLHLLLKERAHNHLYKNIHGPTRDHQQEHIVRQRDSHQGLLQNAAHHLDHLDFETLALLIQVHLHIFLQAAEGRCIGIGRHNRQAEKETDLGRLTGIRSKREVERDLGVLCTLKQETDIIGSILTMNS